MCRDLEKSILIQSLSTGGGIGDGAFLPFHEVRTVENSEQV